MTSGSVVQTADLIFGKLRVLCPPWVFAQIEHRTRGALRTARRASVTPVQNEPVVGVSDKFIRNHFEEFFLDLQDIFARCKARSVRDAKNMGINRHGGLTKGRI